MSHGLTSRQAEILDFIIKFVRKNGMPPTIAEIGKHFQISSTNAVSDHLRALERKGFITRSSKARSIRLTPKIHGNLTVTEVTMVPLVGRIAAGTPVFAEEYIESYVPVEASRGKQKLFALRVQGDSMIDAGILPGDIIIVDSTSSPVPGDIVVAIVDGEATVKRYYLHGEHIVELKPENKSMKSMFYNTDVVQIQGVVVALQRTLR